MKSRTCENVNGFSFISTIHYERPDNLLEKSLRGKKALITGGSTGIGRQITLLLSALGANCLICGRNQEPIDETIRTTENKCSGKKGDAYCGGCGHGCRVLPRPGTAC